MNRKIFTPNELVKIRKSPYVKSATSNQLYEAGIGFYKKNYFSGQGGRTEMLNQSKLEIKFGIIREMTSRDNNMLNISWLCTIAGVSRSGYYRCIAAENSRNVRSGLPLYKLQIY